MQPTPPPVLADAVRHELKGERVLWADAPDPWRYASGYIKGALFGIPFTAFAVFWTFGVSSGRRPPPAPPQDTRGIPDFFAYLPDFFVLWGLMFIGIGLSILLSPLYRAWLAGRTYYVVTERRAVILSRSWKTTVQSFDAATLGRFERVSSGGAGGHIVFDRVHRQAWPNSGEIEVGFLGLRDYAPAEQALRRVLAAHQGAAVPASA